MAIEIVFICKDKDGVVIICTSDVWKHISTKHQMGGLEGVIRAVIESPDGICRSKNYRNRRTLYKDCVLPAPWGNTTVRVVVRYRRKPPFFRKEGDVRTALPCNGMQEGEVLIWGKEI